MNDGNERDTLQYQTVFHQDLIDDSLTNPIPRIIEDVVERVYAEAERHGATIIQWRITYSPALATNIEEMRSGPEALAFLAGRRVMRMTAHTTGGTGGGWWL